MTHNWSIPEREYARQEARRGRRHAFETLDPRTTALAVIDMVPFFADANSHTRDAIPQINLLAQTLRDAGGVVAWVLPSSDDPHPEWSLEFYGPEIAELFRTSGGTGSLPQRLCPELRHAPLDVFVEKTSSSAFFPGHSPLPDILRARDIRTVIVTGTVTNVCCESSARDARTLGYRVILVADANATISDAAHNATLFTVYRSFGDVRTTDEVLGLIRAGSVG